MPRRVRPKLRPEWNVRNMPDEWITWEHANTKLENEQVYWISTASLEGKPHAAPVWGIWEENALYFETDPKFPKGKNLARSPRVIFHVQDGMDTVIVEGKVKRETNQKKLDSLKTDYVRKYEPDWSDEQKQIVFRVAPEIAHAWRAPRMHRSLVKFIF